MRIISILLLSFLLHLMVFSVDNKLFSPSGENTQSRKISYSVRSIDSFRPFEKSVGALPTKQIIQKTDPNRSVKKKKIEGKSVSNPEHDKIPKRANSDNLKKVVEHKIIAEDLLVENPVAVVSDEGVIESKRTEIEPILEPQTAEQSSMAQATALMAEDLADTSEGFDGQINEEMPAGLDVYQSALPRYDINPRPKYPRVARSRGWEGVVLFDVLVLKDGRVGRMKILSSSGYRSLDSAAKKVLRRWKFIPATTLGLPVESQVQVPIRFSLQTL